jgi:LysM repeat protein
VEARVTPKRFGIFVAVNVAVSLLATLAVLWAWQSLRGPAASPGLGLGTPLSTRVSVPSLVAASATPTAASGPVRYVVQAGDTLSSIATHYNVSVEDIMAANGLTNPNTLSVGQELIIPVGGLPTATPVTPTATVPVTPPTPIATATEGPGGAPLLKIAGVTSPGELSEETVLLTNDGSPVRLDGWTLGDTQGNTYTFPSLTLWTGGAVTVHTGNGQDKPTDVYWNRAAPVWEHGDVATLKNPAGATQASYSVP